jgi:DNA-binding response OmpR family regulator
VQKINNVKRLISINVNHSCQGGKKMSKKVLIIDDEMRMGRLLKTYLEKNAFSADVTGDGTTGLIRALNLNYDLIILNVLLPGMDGFHVLKELRKLKSTPVIMLSTQDDRNVVNFFLKSGATDYVVKPFSCNGMVEKVKQLIS